MGRALEAGSSECRTAGELPVMFTKQPEAGFAGESRGSWCVLVTSLNAISEFERERCHELELLWGIVYLRVLVILVSPGT